jgi:hypothetical protein
MPWCLYLPLLLVSLFKIYQLKTRLPCKLEGNLVSEHKLQVWRATKSVAKNFEATCFHA